MRGAHLPAYKTCGYNVVICCDVVEAAAREVAESFGIADFNIADHGVHWIDLAHHFTGRTPARVKCTAIMVPGQVAVSPMIYSATYEYAEPDLIGKDAFQQHRANHAEHQPIRMAY